MTKQTELALVEKFGENSLDEFAKSQGIYGGQWRSLTNSEAQAILKYGSLERAKNAIIAARQAAGATSLPSTQGEGSLTQVAPRSAGIGEPMPDLFGDLFPPGKPPLPPPVPAPRRWPKRSRKRPKP
jgi:hypothetical protein